MVSIPTPIFRREVARVRVRIGWRGKLILQVSNRLERMPLVGDDDAAGFSEWRDADARNPAELAQVIELLAAQQRNKESSR